VRGVKRDAQRELARLLHSLDTGGYVEPNRLTVGEYLRLWLDDYAKANVSAKTFERYEEIVRLHLTPGLGNLLLTKLHPLHIQELYSRALETGRCDKKGGLSTQTVLHHHRVLRQALQQAVRWRLLVANPADAVKPPRPKRKVVMPPSEEQTMKLLDAARTTRLYTPILLVLAAGMRRGEVLGLRWQDVDLKAGTLMVRQTLEQTRAGLSFKEPKTAKGRRLLPLPAVVAEHLRRHKKEQAAERLQLGPAYGHATQLLLRGVHPKVVSERLGHSTIAITLDTYSHVMPSLQEEAAEKLDVALRSAIAGNRERES
jgi:integrase